MRRSSPRRRVTQQHHHEDHDNDDDDEEEEEHLKKIDSQQQQQQNKEEWPKDADRAAEASGKADATTAGPLFSRRRTLSHLAATKQWGKWLLKRRPFFFGIGIAVGLLVAFLTLSLWRHNGMLLSIDQSQAALTFADVNPSSAFLNALQNVWPENNDLFKSVSGFLADQLGYAAKEQTMLPGKKLRKSEKLAPSHPVVLVPGIVSTGLESWSSTACTETYFRKRIWGEMTMGRMMLLDKECWLSHLLLDPETGLDPPDIRLRAAQGLDAADYLIGPYWVWGKLIENLGAIGYDNNNLHMAAYDWRLSVTNMEKRDFYFTKLKSLIEVNVKASRGKKAVLIAHSMGTNILLYFFKWVESRHGGGGGDRWVDEHIDSLVNIGGPLLGLPKTISSVLSGEMRDTAQMGRIMSYFLDRFFTKSQRAGLFRSWMGGSTLLPKGLDRIWGDGESAPDDTDQRQPQTNGTVQTYGQMLRFDQASIDAARTNRNVTLPPYLTAADINSFLVNNTERTYAETMQREYDWGILDKETLRQRPDTYDASKYWTNPLTMQLPNAPRMKVYCLYGIGKETERAYHYQSVDHHATSNDDANDDDTYLPGREGGGGEEGNVAPGAFEESKHGEKPMAGAAPPLKARRSPQATTHEDGHAATASAKDTVQNGEKDQKRTKRTASAMTTEGGEDSIPMPPNWPPKPPKVRYQINTEIDDRANNVDYGVQDTDGDGTVPLISLAYMCVEGWQKPELNPHQIEVITQEFHHSPVSTLSDVRGGPNTADHVDILGNNALATSVLRIVAGHGHKVKTSIRSRIREIARRIKLWDDDTHHQGSATEEEMAQADAHDSERHAASSSSSSSEA